MKPRSTSFLTEITGNWSDRELKQNFRVGRATFNFLSRELKGFLQRQHVVAEENNKPSRTTIYNKQGLDLIVTSRLSY